MPELTLYMKHGCHLCEEAAAVLGALQSEVGFTVRPVDITQDKALYDRFRYDIPVVEHDGQLLLSWPFGPAMARIVLAQRLPHG